MFTFLFTVSPQPVAIESDSSQDDNNLDSVQSTMTVTELDLSNPQSSTNSQSHTKLREESEMLKKELKKAKENHKNLANNISALFNEDQIAYLSKKPGYGKG